jgi:hypothetical protein
MVPSDLTGPSSRKSDYLALYESPQEVVAKVLVYVFNKFATPAKVELTKVDGAFRVIVDYDGFIHLRNAINALTGKPPLTEPIERVPLSAADIHNALNSVLFEEKLPR